MFEWIFSGFQQRLVYKQERFIAKIYSGALESIPEGFNVVRISLDASERSLLLWEKEKRRAKELVNLGYFLLWDLCFALLEGSLEDPSRLVALELAAEHFTKQVFPEFNNQTFGVLVFQGSLTDIEQEGMLHTLRSLMARLPDSLLCFIALDTYQITDAATYFAAIQQEFYGRFQLILKGAYPMHFPYAFAALGWDHPYSSLGFFSDILLNTHSECRIHSAICLPEEGYPHTHINQVIATFDTKPFRILTEKALVYEWEGIDELIVFSDAVTPKMHRKLLGFCAAEGTVRVVGNSLQLPRETPL